MVKKFVLLVLVTLALLSSVTAQKVYISPEEGGTEYCNTEEVELWVNATEFQGGQINLTYDSNCVDVGWSMNIDAFPLGASESNQTDYIWITFANLTSNLTGEFLIGTLSVHCINRDEDCSTQFNFDLAHEKNHSALFGSWGNELEGISWIGGTFNCEKGSSESQSTPAPSGGGGGGGGGGGIIYTPPATPTPAEVPTSESTAEPVPSVSTATPEATVTVMPTKTPESIPTATSTLAPAETATPAPVLASWWNQPTGLIALVAIILAGAVTVVYLLRR